jgi:hypothetical protein
MTDVALWALVVSAFFLGYLLGLLIALREFTKTRK